MSRDFEFTDYLAEIEKSLAKQNPVPKERLNNFNLRIKNFQIDSSLIRFEENTTPNRDQSFPPAYRVWDGVEMRMREILAKNPVGAGKVQVGVYRTMFETDANGIIRRYVLPYYRTF